MSQEQVTKLQEKVNDGVQSTQSALDDIAGSFKSHDSEFNPKETASSYMDEAVNQAKKALDELKKAGEDLRSKDSAPVHLVEGALKKLENALNAIKTTAGKYDEEYQVSNKISTKVDQVKEQASGFIHAAMEQAAEINTSVKGTADAAGNTAKTVAGSVVNKIGEYDEYYKVIETVANAATAATGKAKELDDYYGVSKKAMEVDNKVTGGIGTAAVAKGNEYLQTGTEYAKESIQALQAKKEEAAKEE